MKLNTVEGDLKYAQLLLIAQIFKEELLRFAHDYFYVKISAINTVENIFKFKIYHLNGDTQFLNEVSLSLRVLDMTEDECKEYIYNYLNILYINNNRAIMSQPLTIIYEASESQLLKYKMLMYCKYNSK